MDAKKIAAMVVLIAVIVVALIFVAKRAGLGGGATPPPSVFQTSVELMDTDSGELITKTAKEWEDLGKQDGAYKNPSTGKYTMVYFMACAACGANIPTVTAPAEVRMTPGGFERWEATLQCPKCGKSPFPKPGVIIRRTATGGARGKAQGAPKEK